VRIYLPFFCLLLFAGNAAASGHGPLFGYATPTNSKGEYSIDLGLIGRIGSAGSQIGPRTMLTYGFTPHLQVSLNAPALWTNAAHPMTMLTGGDDFAANVGWRFHHNAKAVGTRFESTVFGGIVVPGPQQGAGVLGMLNRAPGFSFAGVSGLASRSHYLWLGAGVERFAERAGDRRPTTLSYSLVYGYRPPQWRTEANHWDWRLFGELTGEASSRAEHGGVLLPESHAHQIFVGPSALGIVRNYAVEFGVQVPIYHDVGRLLPAEKVRFAVNFSYFHFHHQH
jgi:hypothetical protein